MKTLLALATTTALGWALPAAAQAAPDVYDKCASNVNGIGGQLYARSCAAAWSAGAGPGGQYAGSAAGIGNGHVDTGNSYYYAPGTSQTSWADNGWSNRADATSNTGGVSWASSSLVDGTLHSYVSNGTSFFHGGATNTRISDIVSFTNLSGSDVLLPIGYAFDGSFTPGPNGFDGYTNGLVALALGTPSGQPSTVRFANSGSFIGGIAQSYFDANGGYLQQAYYNAGQPNDFQFAGSYNLATGFIQGTFGTTLVIPTGVSTMGFAFTLSLDCRTSGGICDFANTGALGFGTLPAGVSYTSDSGVLFSAPPSVPEPGTWAMMILGFGAAGVATRARRRVAMAQ